MVGGSFMSQGFCILCVYRTFEFINMVSHDWHFTEPYRTGTHQNQESGVFRTLLSNPIPSALKRATLPAYPAKTSSPQRPTGQNVTLQ